MKQISIYQSLSPVEFDLPKLAQEAEFRTLTGANQFTEGLITVHEDTDDLFSNIDNKFIGFRYKSEKRADPCPITLDRTMQAEVEDLTERGVTFDWEQLCERVTDTLIKSAKITQTEFEVFYDIQGKRFLVDKDRNTAELAISFLSNYFEAEELHLVKTDPTHCENVFTSWAKGDLIPADEIQFDEGVIELGKKTLAGKKVSQNKLVILKKAYIEDEVVIKHINSGKVITSIELGYDGVIYPVVDHTGVFKSISYEESLKGKTKKEKEKEDYSISSEYHSERLLRLTEIGKMLDLLLPVLGYELGSVIN